MNTNPCEHCGGTKIVQIPCPDKKTGCAVFHGKECEACKPPIQQEKPSVRHTIDIGDATEVINAAGVKMVEEKPTAEEIAKVQKLLMDAPVPTEGRHFINTMTGEIDDPTGIDFGVFGSPDANCDCICHSQVELCSNCVNLQSPCVEPNQELEQTVEDFRDVILKQVIPAMIARTMTTDEAGDITDTAQAIAIQQLQKLIAHEKQEARKEELEKFTQLEGIKSNFSFDDAMKIAEAIDNRLAELERTEGEGK